MPAAAAACCWIVLSPLPLSCAACWQQEYMGQQMARVHTCLSEPKTF
jgi:fructosamine-3-kinase